MMLYIDDDSVESALVRELRQAGHDVRTPAEAGLDGANDPIHLAYAIREGRAILTRNYDDFNELHLLIRDAQGRHLGVLTVRFARQKRRFLKPHEIVRALNKLEGAGVPIANEHSVLNHWQ